jgi:hypothetical protein
MDFDSFSRRDLFGIEHRTLDEVRGDISTPPLSTAHAPEYEKVMRELAGAIQPDAAITDPAERARFVLDALQGLREDFIANSGSREALGLEGLLRAERDPAPPPLRSDSEIYAAALHLLSNREE